MLREKKIIFFLKTFQNQENDGLVLRTIAWTCNLSHFYLSLIEMLT